MNTNKEISEDVMKEILLKIKLPIYYKDFPEREQVLIECVSVILEEFSEFVFRKEFKDVEYKPITVIISPGLVKLDELLEKYKTGRLITTSGLKGVLNVDGKETYVILLRNINFKITTYFHELYHCYWDVKGMPSDKNLYYHQRPSEVEAVIMARKLNYKYGKTLKEKLELCKRGQSIDTIEDMIKKLRKELDRIIIEEAMITSL